VIADADFHGKPPAGARIVDGSGRTLLPGLIDAQVHAFHSAPSPASIRRRSPW
jgi:imidazolonepropionase-like amidohydrolase